MDLEQVYQNTCQCLRCPTPAGLRTERHHESLQVYIDFTAINTNVADAGSLFNFIQGMFMAWKISLLPAKFFFVRVNVRENPELLLKVKKARVSDKDWWIKATNWAFECKECSKLKNWLKVVGTDKHNDNKSHITILHNSDCAPASHASAAPTWSQFSYRSGLAQQ